jgi:organic hydroperoxide reductase OsmC/OhrA
VLLRLSDRGVAEATTAMQQFPHRYEVVAAGDTLDDIELASGALPVLRSAPPVEFDGPGDRWSPETLLVGAVAGCYVLTFRAVARASRVAWTWLRCEVTGTVERVDKGAQFTEFGVRARLSIPPTMDAQLARRALEKAENQCLIAKSLKATIHLAIEIDIDDVEIQPSAVAEAGS